MQLTPAEDLTIGLRRQHRQTWRHRPEWRWYLGLWEEVIELGLALLKLHSDSPDWELRQIGAIAINWQEMRNELP